jgi:hypothetical protein
MELVKKDSTLRVSPLQRLTSSLPWEITLTSASEHLISRTSTTSGHRVLVLTTSGLLHGPCPTILVSPAATYGLGLYDGTRT